MAGKSVKNKRKYKALRRKGMPKSRAAKISNAGKSASRKGGRNSSRSRRSSSSKSRSSRSRSKK